MRCDHFECARDPFICGKVWFEPHINGLKFNLGPNAKKKTNTATVYKYYIVAIIIYTA